MIAVLAPLVNSYKRLVPGYEAPTYLTWGRTNRSALIRVPKVSPGKSIEGTRAEVRCPDPSSNTYLAFAVMIAAGLDGVEKGLQLADPVEESLFEMDAATIAAKGIRELPGTLGEAIDELEADEVDPRSPRRPRLQPLRRGQARRVGRVPHPGHRLGARPLPRPVLGGDPRASQIQRAPDRRPVPPRGPPNGPQRQGPVRRSTGPEALLRVPSPRRTA